MDERKEEVREIETKHAAASECPSAATPWWGAERAICLDIPPGAG